MVINSKYQVHVCCWLWLVVFVVSGLAELTRVPPALEALDERHDAEIYRAVVASINDWKRKQLQKQITNRIKREDVPSACYPDLGCFEASGPFGYLDTLPNKPEEISTKFWLYPGRSRRRNGSPPAEVPFDRMDDAFEWAKQGFNKSLPTKVLIHGFGSDCSYIWVYEIRSALMAVEEVNIICVDWSNGAALPNYVKASANTRLVGKQLSLLLRGLVEKNGLSLRDTHLIGFSLGAHIAGFAGADLGNLSRITGLDPAGPLFEAQDPRARLDETDAAFVDVIHSNGENLILGGLGSSQPMGHVDFFPNGGRMQKGCSHLFVGAVTDIIWSTAVEGRSLCNHRRAYKFFIDSISPRCHFPAFPCSSYDDYLAGKCFPCTEGRQCGNMGYYADRSKGRGQLYLITRDEEPFCAHQYLVKIESLPSPLPVKSYGKIQITVVGESLLNETFMMTRKEDEEMTLGHSISRIIVPHPILAQPSRIEILYTAYSGWLSSGLTQWRMDKVTLMDSFGKMSSVCKKNLILHSGVPVLLPLYPGECNLPKEPFEASAEDRVGVTDEKPNHNDKQPDFTPTQVVRVGLDDKVEKSDKPNLFLDAMGIFNIPWSNDKENDILDAEASESSRAFNTRIIKVDNAIASNEDGLVKEIVEPILKPLSNKNARSHDPDREKVEITEPILGPTTSKTTKTTTTAATSTTTTAQTASTYKAPVVELNNEKKSSVKITFDNDWVPKPVPTKPRPEGKRKRQDESKVMTGFDQPSHDPFDSFATTVQFLPQRLARMFQQAEKYARDNILPLVSTYTPKFIADIITPRETTPKYVPLHYDETTTRKSPKPKSKSIPESEKSLFEVSESRHVIVEKEFEPVTDPTTPYTHIQRITKKTEQEEAELKSRLKASTTMIMMSTTSIPESSPTTTHVSTTTSTKKAVTATTKEYNRRARDDNNVQPLRPPQDPFEAIISQVQVLPENLGRMFQQAERFTRNTVLPLVSRLTPRFITNMFNPRPREGPRYIPFSGGETTVNTPTVRLNEPGRNKRNQKFNPPPSIKVNLDEDSTTTTTEASTKGSYIQKIPKRKKA